MSFARIFCQSRLCVSNIIMVAHMFASGVGRVSMLNRTLNAPIIAPMTA